MNVRLLIYHQIGELNILMLSAKKKSEKDSLWLPGATRTRRTLFPPPLTKGATGDFN
jgi:hypothetical protein